MVDVLIPDVLRPIPSSLTQAIRNFAKNLESWLTSAMTGCPDKIVQIKIAAVSAFSQTLRRYTSLNHLAQAARAVLQNGSQISQMLNDLNRVDFHNVQVGESRFKKKRMIYCQRYFSKSIEHVNRNKRLGCANVTRRPFSVWRTISKRPYNNKTHSNNGRRGCDVLSIRHWTNIGASQRLPKLPGNFCSNGVFTVQWLSVI